MLFESRLKFHPLQEGASGLVVFMRRLPKQGTGQVYLIVDGHPVDKSRLVKAFVTRNATRLRLILLPGYCPELNQDVKTNALRKSRPGTSRG